MASPFRDRRFGADEVRRILRRAAELADRDPDTSNVERALTRDEIERAAGELGLPRSAVARAIETAGGDAPTAQPDSPLLGAPTRLVFEAEVEGEPSEADREDLLEEIRNEMGQTGAFESIGGTLIWKLSPDYRGRGRELSVRLRSRDGRTKIVVDERLVRQATGLFVGLGVGGGLSPMGGYIAAVANLGVLALVIPLVWIPLMLLLARTLYGALVERRERALRALLRRVVKSAEQWSASPAAQVRVAPPVAPVEGSAPGDDPAEPADLAASRHTRSR
jgi:hypothetical protein